MLITNTRKLMIMIRENKMNKNMRMSTKRSIKSSP